jgi:integrase/recombinase XerD
MEELHKMMEADLAIGKYSKSTRRVYLYYARRYAAFYKRSPSEMGACDVREFLLHLAEKCKLSRSSLKQARAALKFLYSVTLNRPMEVSWIPLPRKKKMLPNLLSGSEVESVLKATRVLKFRAIFAIMYAAGLRISEACRLRPEHIDSKRMVIRVVGKGSKERLTILSPRLLDFLRRYWKATRPAKDGWLFPGRSNDGGTSYEAARIAFQKAKIEAGITRKVSQHALRHSFATHLIDMGCDVTTVQALLGHTDLRTTMVYTHAGVLRIAGTRSPFDLLGSPSAEIFG